MMSEILSFEASCFDGIMVFFDDLFLLSFFSKYGDVFKSSAASSTEICIVQSSDALHDTFGSIKPYLELKHTNEALLQLKFEEILLQLLDNDRSKKIHTYLKALYTGGLFALKAHFDTGNFENVEEMIRSSKLPEEKFRRLFHELYAMTPKEWLASQALTKARHLLQEGRLNVSEVSLECGFRSLSWFIKRFKESYGVTPKQFQQNWQKSEGN